MDERERLADLANRAMGGDRQAMQELYELVSPRLHQVLRRRCADNPVLAGRVGPSDLVQSVFRWLCRFRHGPREAVRDAEAFLISVGRKRVAHYVRMYTGATRDRALERGGEGALGGVAACDPSPSSVTTKQEEEELFGRAIAKLTSDEQAWIDRWLQGGGKKYAELAPEFGTSEGALKKRHQRILKKLAAYLTEARTHGRR